MTNLFKGELGEGLAFLGDQAQAGLELEDLRFLREDLRAKKAAGKRSVLEDMVAVAREARKANTLWEPVLGNLNAIRVNLDAPLQLPFAGATVEWNRSPDGPLGWVTVERRGGDLYVGDRKLVLHLTEGQKKGAVQGHAQRTALEGLETWHPNILDALVEAWEQGIKLIPEGWKQNDRGETQYLFSFQVGFRNSDGRLYVRYVCWNDGRWDRRYTWLGGNLGVQRPVVAFES